AAADIPSRTRTQNKFSRSFNTTLDAITNTSLIRCCFDPLKPPYGYETSHDRHLGTIDTGGIPGLGESLNYVA
ncbi:hypothetical protein, partial [Cryobacterium sp. 10I5]|uniref:hypothetical protein n=1 Tax=Cryobacterium sp. 10I5 TaxID=3048581 RepID=UPI002B23703A